MTNEEKMRYLRIDILREENKNLKTQAKSDQKMVEEIAKMIQSYTKQRM